MDLEAKLKKSAEIKMIFESETYKKDYEKMNTEEFFRKYYSFMPDIFLDNINSILKEYYENKDKN